MCTLVILRRPDHRWPLLLAANRDEMAARPWLPPARHWPERPNVIAGLDLLGGGSWFGLNDHGVAAGVMNSGLLANPTPDSKYDYAPAPPELLQRALAMKAVTERRSVPLRAAALQFVFGHPLVVSVVAGVRTVAHLDDAVANLQQSIPPELWDDLRREGLLPEGVPTP